MWIKLKHWQHTAPAQEACSPAVVALVEQAVGCQGAAAPVLRVLGGRAVAVRRVVLGAGASTEAVAVSHAAVELHAGNDGLGERGGGWGGRRGSAIVVILTTHNGRLLHLQRTGVQAKQGKSREGNEKWRRMKMKAKHGM